MLSLAGLTLPGLPPSLLVDAAADAGFNAVGVNLNQLWRTVSGDPRWFSAEVEHIEKALAARGLQMMHGGHLLLGGLDRHSIDHVIAAMEQLQVRHLVLVADPNATEQRVAEDFSYVRAQVSDIPMLVEFAPYTGWRNLADAMRFIQTHSDTPLSLVMDVLHLVRSKSLEAWLVGASWPVGLIQVCDAPLKAPNEDGLQMEARGNRLDVGEGALPLADIFKNLAQDIPIEVEAPCLALRNLSPQDRAKRSFQHLAVFLQSQGYPFHVMRS